MGGERDVVPMRGQAPSHEVHERRAPAVGNRRVREQVGVSFWIPPLSRELAWRPGEPRATGMRFALFHHLEFGLGARGGSRGLAW